MLLDHGIDAFLCCTMNPIMLMKLLQIGNSVKTLVCLFVCSSPFYYATLEFYYTGELVLTQINGADEGSLGYLGFCIIAGLYGS